MLQQALRGREMVRAAAAASAGAAGWRRRQEDRGRQTASIKVRGGWLIEVGRQARPASSYVSSGGRLRWSCGEEEGEGRGEQSGASCSSTKARSSS